MQPLTLDNINWLSFKIGDIFNISTGCNIPKNQIKKGDVPRITAKATDNGIDDFTSPHIRYRYNENCISVSFLGNCFYQPYRATYDMKIHSITIKNRELNRHLGLFIANQLNREFKKFSYGNQLSSTDLPKQHVLLPINADNQPDWDFMEAYMRQQEKQILQPIIKQLCNQLIYNELMGVKFTSLILIGKNFILRKSSPIYNVANVSKKQTTKTAIRPMFPQLHKTMEWTDLSEMKAA